MMTRPSKVSESSKRLPLMTGRRADEEILRDLRQLLAAEILLGDCSVDPGCSGALHGAPVLFPEGYAGRIDLGVNDGVVTLEGEVVAGHEKRRAGQLARRVPGCRGVVNALVVAARRR
jgi:hypothetical protein